ncbi:hypothetical protein QBZ16_003343 [Prototheca wickerhamii]|uniref:RNA-polymerase II-associated protein 3-like C-terminal domain-containing protein n=1 Tax=Prototheca wickerhamii TaxID=3111 RepID=A0AAD9IHS0_PROWI|nr:hypothetical protein QBZ16_003343 [Prototheca wickerhamii]
MGPTQQEEEAERLRQEGNAYFKQGKLVEAEKRYSQSIEAHPSSASFANRAAVYSKQGRWDQVESDCTAALQLDPASVKAYFRRGRAKAEMGRYTEAARDFGQVCRLDSTNAEAAAQRAAALQKASEAAETVGFSKKSAATRLSGGESALADLLGQKSSSKGQADRLEFERHWRGLKTSRVMQGVLLFAYAARTVPRLLGAQLSASLLCDVARCALEFAGDGGAAAGVLEALTQAERFDLAVLGLSAADRRALGALWDRTPGLSAELRSQYRLH